MKAMLLNRVASLDSEHNPLVLADIARPQPQAGEVLLRVRACGVCHTELDIIEGRTPPGILPLIPGHQVVGEVVEAGEGANRHAVGDRLGVGWIFCSSGTEKENISPEFRATGRDAHGGYAEYMTAAQDYAYPIPKSYTDEQAAPLLCAGAVGYRALKLSGISDGMRLGLTGFGGSGHIVLQLAKGLYPESEIFVFARDAGARKFASELGAHWTGAIEETAPQQLDAIIDTTPAWRPIVWALRNLAPGGRLVINAIRKESADKKTLLELDYESDLWMEKEIKSVANVSSFDIAEFLPLAEEVSIRPQVETYPLDEANRALCELKRGRICGAKVLLCS